MKRTLLFLLTLLAASGAQRERAQAIALASPELLARPRPPGVAPSRTSPVFRAREGEWKFNLHSYPAHHDGKFRAVGSSGRVDEDSPTQLIRYATSVDGHRWSGSGILADDPDGPEGPGSWIVNPEGAVRRFFGDGQRSKFLYRSVSRDGGETWPAPVRTNYPDAGSKNFAGRLSNGWYSLINNPNPDSRDPLGISFSRDGWKFGLPLALRSGAPEQRYPGRAKNRFSLQYPHAIEKNGSLWVIHSTTKEDIEIPEHRIADFRLEKEQI